jgi:hypothetical protein
MNRQAFWFLYANVNSIAELAFKLLAAKILSEPVQETSEPVESPYAHLSDEELQAQIMADFEKLNASPPQEWSAPDESADEPVELSEETTEDVVLPPLSESEDAEADEEIDIEKYLSRAYSHEEELRERVDAHFKRADLGAIESALAQLPDSLPSLTGPLTATDIAEWLNLYDQEHPALNDLTLRIRQLDTGGNLA